MTSMVITPSVRLMTTFLALLDVHQRFACIHVHQTTDTRGLAVTVIETETTPEPARNL